MKLHSDSTPGLNRVTAYGEGYIEINRERYEGTIVFGPEGDITALNVRNVTEITAEVLIQAAGVTPRGHDPFAALEESAGITPIPSAAGTQVLLVGTGRRQQFLRSDITRELLRAGVGVEFMDTHAAARTYNILMAEGRRVVALLLPA